MAYALEKRVRDAKALADRLEPSILAKAFRGELSVQVPEEALAWEQTLAELAREAAGLEGTLKAKPKKSRAFAAKAAEPLVAAECEPDYVTAPKKRGRPRKM